MLLEILFIISILSIIVCCIQVPFFSWYYRSIILSIKLDYFYLCFYFIFMQILIATLLCVCNIYFYPSNIVFDVIINILIIVMFTIILNKVIYKSNWSGKYISTLILLLVLVLVPPISLFFIIYKYTQAL